jgi:hypothetical protein
MTTEIRLGDVVQNVVVQNVGLAYPRWVLTDVHPTTLHMYVWMDERGNKVDDYFRWDNGERVIGHVGDMLAEGLVALLLGGPAVEPRRGHPEVATGEVFASLDWI